MLTENQKTKIKLSLMKESLNSLGGTVLFFILLSVALLISFTLTVYQKLDLDIAKYFVFGGVLLFIILSCFSIYFGERHTDKLLKLKENKDDLTEKEMMLSLQLPLEEKKENEEKN